MNQRRQAGLTVVEFAVTGAVFMLIMFGCLEISRLLYTWNTLTEATRAGARIAAVCPPGNDAIVKTAILNEPGGSTSSGILQNLDTADISIQYLTASGSDSGGNRATTEFVRVAITGYQIDLLIPFLDLTLTAPPFSTTLPTESLGLVPNADPTLPGTISCLLPA